MRHRIKLALEYPCSVKQGDSIYLFQIPGNEYIIDIFSDVITRLSLVACTQNLTIILARSTCIFQSERYLFMQKKERAFQIFTSLTQPISDNFVLSVVVII